MRRFVVQKHRATHLHYDLRLEMEGVLKSWALPKEPPKKVGLRRLAIKVEDHDLSYIDFEGEIEEGMYGAGKVSIWDKGTYDLESKKDSKIVFRLNGSKLKGKYVLLRMQWGEDQWLFFRVPAKGKVAI